MYLEFWVEMTRLALNVVFMVIMYYTITRALSSVYDDIRHFQNNLEHLRCLHIQIEGRILDIERKLEEKNGR